MNYQPTGQRKKNNTHGGYYKCSSYVNKRECSPNNVRAKFIEQEVLLRIKHIISNERIIDDVVKELNSNNNIDSGLIHKQLSVTDKEIAKLNSRLNEILQEFVLKEITYDDYKEFKSLIEQRLIELNTKRQEMELELVKALNTSFNVNEIRFVLDNFDKLMENADTQLKKQLMESLIECIKLNPDKTLNSIEFKFEVPNQHISEEQEKNVILTCDTVPHD